MSQLDLAWRNRYRVFIETQRNDSAGGYLRLVRKGSSTVVAVVGAIPEMLLEALGRAPNVAAIAADGQAFDEAASALTRAEGVASPYAVVTVDPLTEVAGQWTAMWTPGSAEHSFETAAGSLIMAWRSGRFELPDYYVVVAHEEAHDADFHLGFLKSQRPGRVVVVPIADHHGELALRILSALPALPQGPWWPAVDRLMDAARDFFPGTIAPEARPPAPDTMDVFRVP